MKRVAVLLAAYNGSNWLEEQLNSLLKQIDINVDIYISVDLSVDYSHIICKEFESKFDNVHLLSYGERFGGAAKNFFRLIKDVDFSVFDYIALSDQDDIWDRLKLSRAVEHLSKYGFDGYSSNVFAFWKNGKKKLIDKAQAQVKWDYLFESAGPGCTFVLTRNLAVTIQEFIKNNDQMNKVWLHDWFIYAYARSHKFKWGIDAHASMLYRQHSLNQVGANSGLKALLYRIKFVLSGKAFEQSYLLAQLCGLNDEPFVKKWSRSSRLSMLYLAANYNKCRRKKFDRILFLFSCLIFIVIGNMSWLKK